MGSVREKVIWVTGASSGIGRSLSLELARRGAILALTARRAEALNDLTHEITEQGGKATAFTGDVTNLNQLVSLAANISGMLGKIDVLVANAGTHVFTDPKNFSSAEYLNLMDINFGGMLRAVEAVLPVMRGQGHGHIVGVASLAGFRGLPRAAAYGASKSAMIHFLESLRFHLADERIDVSIVCPGFVRTPLTDKNDFHMPFLVESDRAARIISNGIDAKRKLITFPIPFNWMLNLARIMPYFLYEKMIYPLWRAQEAHSLKTNKS